MIENLKNHKKSKKIKQRISHNRMTKLNLFKNFLLILTISSIVVSQENNIDQRARAAIDDIFASLKTLSTQENRRCPPMHESCGNECCRPKHLCCGWRGGQGCVEPELKDFCQTK